MACSALHPVSCIGSAAKAVAGDAFAAIARDFGRAAEATINWLWAQLSQASAVHLGGAGFHLDLSIVAAITAVVALGLFVIQVTTSALRRDPGGLGRAVKGLVVAFLAGGAAIGVTNVLLSATDSLSAGVVKAAMGTDLAGMGRHILIGAAILGVGNPAGIILLAVATIVAAVAVWLALMVRKVLIVVSAVFAPLAFAGSLADITVSWTRRWIEVMVALIASKLVLVVVFVVGWGVLDQGVGLAGHGAGQSITQVAAGLLILAVAGFAPWMALKLVHFSGEQFHHLHALAGSATVGAQAALAAPQKVAAWAPVARMGAGGMARVAGTQAGGAGGGGGTGANPAQGVPQPVRDIPGAGSGKGQDPPPPAPAPAGNGHGPAVGSGPAHRGPTGSPGAPGEAPPARSGPVREPASPSTAGPPSPAPPPPSPPSRSARPSPPGKS
ncbi:MAG: hypothetical protein ACRDZQ_14690 [Acidimicrobiales bacterium]